VARSKAAAESGGGGSAPGGKRTVGAGGQIGTVLQPGGRGKKRNTQQWAIKFYCCAYGEVAEVVLPVATDSG